MTKTTLQDLLNKWTDNLSIDYLTGLSNDIDQRNHLFLKIESHRSSVSPIMYEKLLIIALFYNLRINDSKKLFIDNLSTTTLICKEDKESVATSLHELNSNLPQSDLSILFFKLK